MTSKHREYTSLGNVFLVLLALVPALPVAAADWRELPDEALAGPQSGAPSDIARDFIRKSVGRFGLTGTDVEDAIVGSSHQSDLTGLTHIYLRQRYQGIEVIDGNMNVHIARDGSVFKAGSSYVSDLATKAQGQKPEITAGQAVRAAAAILDLTPPKSLRVLSRAGGPAQVVEFDGTGLSHSPIRVRLVYQRNEAGILRLSWDLAIAMLTDENYWNLRIDARTSELVELDNWTDHDSYRVYAFPAESPNHVAPAPPLDGRRLVMNPADPIASPLGWTTTTFTNGNNVDAFEDTDNDGTPTGGNAARADGPGQVWDFVWDWAQQPTDGTNQDAAITNLFYWNNMIHDVLFHNGFNEAAGNFQVTNVTGLGLGNDPVQAQAQDGGGTNLASFLTLVEGSRPIMTIALWDGAPENMFVVNTPPAVAGSYPSVEARYTPLPLPVPGPPGLTNELVLVSDGTAMASQGCNPLVNGPAVAGKIALVDRGTCSWNNKAENAENAGAIAMVVMNNIPGAGPFAMGGFNFPFPSTIPAITIGTDDGIAIKNALLGGPVNATLVNPPGVVPMLDGALDHGIIIHEYGHGVSNRLVGGPANVGCIGSVAEQAGEGWSDLLAIILTMEPGDQGSDVRGIGTFASGQAPTGVGRRPFPFSTDQVVSPYVYSGTQGANTHVVGAHWAAIAWDLVWALTNCHGFDPDLINGEGGNRLALQYVLEGMKLQPCNEVTFCDNRDGILAAIAAATGQPCSNQMTGPHGSTDCCLAVQAFAIRGLGLDAQCGADNSNDDNIDGFGVPTNCTPSCTAPTCQTTAAAGATATTVCQGSSITLDASSSVQTGCTGTRLYQWIVDGLAIPGATNATYMTDPGLSSGIHMVDVRLTCSTDPTCTDTLDAPILLTVVSVTANAVAASTGFCFGQTTNIDAATSTSPSCTGPLAYQWYVDGNPVAGATNSTYTTSPTLPGGTHSIDVEVACSVAPACPDRLNTPIGIQVGAVAVSCNPGGASGAVSTLIPIGQSSTSDGATFTWTQSSPTGSLQGQTSLNGAQYMNTVAGVYTTTLRADRNFGSFVCSNTCDVTVNVGGGCSAVAFNRINPLLAVKNPTQPTIDFSWTADPANPPAYHLNRVQGPKTNLLDPTTGGAGSGAIGCTSTSPAVACGDVAPPAPTWMGVLFYQALSSCTTSIGNEGPF